MKQCISQERMIGAHTCVDENCLIKINYFKIIQKRLWRFEKFSHCVMYNLRQCALPKLLFFILNIHCFKNIFPMKIKMNGYIFFIVSKKYFSKQSDFLWFVRIS